MFCQVRLCKEGHLENQTNETDELQPLILVILMFRKKLDWTRVERCWLKLLRSKIVALQEDDTVLGGGKMNEL